MFAHIDVDAFFASVLVRRDPSLKGKPLLALGMGGGCVIAASYEAKALGVKTGMPLYEAIKLAPKALKVQSDFREACVASDQIESILRDVCPFVEQMSVDEWYVDLAALQGGIPRDLPAWGKKVQRIVRESTSLTVSVGMGPSKLLAKMASEYRKPAGVTAVRQCHAEALSLSKGRSTTLLPNQEPMLSIEAFLKDRPAEAIPGIGPRRKLHTKANGWDTAWDIATANTHQFQTLFGKPGKEMQQELLGEPVYGLESVPAPQKSISRCRSFKPCMDRAVIYGHLLEHLNFTVLKMRDQKRMCTHIAVWVRHTDYQHWGTDRKLPLPRPIQTEEELLPYVRACFNHVHNPRQKYTQVGLALLGLRPQSGVQYSLFQGPDDTDKREQIQGALDNLHHRYGRIAVTRGSAISLLEPGEKEEQLPDIYGEVIDVR